MISEILEILGLVSNLPNNKNDQSILGKFGHSSRHFVSDQNLITKMLSEFKMLERDLVKSGKQFIDNNTGNIWLSYFVNMENKNGGTQILAKLPLPATKQIINILLSTKYEDELFAACKILVENENQKSEKFRPYLIEQLEKIDEQWKKDKIILLTNLI